MADNLVQKKAATELQQTVQYNSAAVSRQKDIRLKLEPIYDTKHPEIRVKKKNSMQLKAIAKQSNEKHSKVNQFDIKEEARRNNSSEFVLKQQQEEVQTHRCVE